MSIARTMAMSTALLVAVLSPAPMANELLSKVVFRRLNQAAA